MKVQNLSIILVEAFLQAKRRRRVFIKPLRIYGKLFSEYAACCGTSAMLINEMYDMTLSG
jgi:hypothetical protein